MNVSAYNVVAGKPERQRRPGGFRCRDENNIKIYLGQGARVWTGFKTNLHFFYHISLISYYNEKGFRQKL